jgi:hypothetical protein
MDLPENTPIVELSPTDTSYTVVEKIAAAIGTTHGLKSMSRDRPYIGQPHTVHGVRGKQGVFGLTMRDLMDCMIRGYVLSCWSNSTNAPIIEEAKKGEGATINGSDIFKLTGDVDPIAVMQNTLCEIEKVMGIFPNIELDSE